MKNFSFLSKFWILLPVFVFFSTLTFSRTINTSDSENPSLKLSSSTPEGIKLVNVVGNIKIGLVETNNTTYARLILKGYVKNSEFGNPELPVRRELIEIPFSAEPVVKIISYDVAEYSLEEYGVAQQLVPVQYPQPKCGDSPQFICNNQFYQKNEFNADPLVTVDVLGVLRNVRLARVNVKPIQYNPFTNSIRVYENINFEIFFGNADQKMTSAVKQKLHSPYFSNLLNGIINYSSTENRENMTVYPIKYVIVSDRMFEEQLQPFIEWKTKKGFDVVVAYLDEIGETKEEIKDYLQNLYEEGTVEDPAPSFILFVGDIDQVPVWENGNGVTDRNYCEYTDDIFPDVFYGRFSAENTEQLQPYIDKTLQYEQFTMPDPAYLDEVVMIAGMDGTYGASHGNGQINYGTTNYFNEDHNIFSYTYLYPESGSHDADIIQNVSDGVGFANYTAHGWSGGWADPAFSISDIPSLENQDKYGLLIGNCCSTSEYQTTSFAEEIVRTPDKGAVGYIGGSNSTYWDEDYYFGVGVGTISETPPPYEETGLGNYDRAFHDHGEEFGDWYTTMDQHVFAGNLAVSESGSGLEDYYWDIYNLMGDPSLMVYYSVPEEMVVSHSNTIMIGGTMITVDAAPYAYIGISYNGVLHGAAIADAGGHADLVIEPFFEAGQADIVVSSQNFQPYIGIINITPAEGPYVVFSEFLVNDEAGNGNGQIDYHETILFSISMENVGVEEAQNTEVTLSCSDPFVTILDSTENYGSIPAGEIVTVSNGFAFTVSDSITDGSQVHFMLSVTEEGGGEFVSVFNAVCHSYFLAATYQSLDDTEGGNGNGKLDPGETAIVEFSLGNSGSSSVYNISAQLSSTSEYITVNSEVQQIDGIEPSANQSVNFSITSATDAPEGIIAVLQLDWFGDYSVEGSDAFDLVIGQIPVLILDFTNGSPSVEAMKSSFEVLTVGSETMSTIPAPLSAYKSLFICLGVYPSNHVLSGFEANALASYLGEGGKIYMEGGDTWAYDQQTSLHEMFYIHGISDGDGDLSTVTGKEGTFSEIFEFPYTGANSYIDQIEPMGDAFTLFRNEVKNYDVAVAFVGENYKTIGTSFEFGGLTETETSTRDGLMANILDFFEIYFIWTKTDDKMANPNFISIYPNPTSDQININIFVKNDQNAAIYLCDIVGKRLGQYSTSRELNKGKNIFQLNVSDLESGVYNLIINTFGNNICKKIVVSH